MKKFIAVIVAAVICMSMFGCSTGNANVDATPTTVATEPATPAEVDISQFPDAKEFDVYEWPSFGLAANLPTPMWSNRGVCYDSADLFMCDVGYATVEDFNSYVKACQQAGYTNNYFNMPGEIYYGENEDGQAVMIGYAEYWYYVEIWSAFDTSDWPMGW